MQLPNSSQQPSIEPLPDLSWVAELLFLFFAVALLLWVGYRLWSRSSSPVMKVLARLPLEPKRTLYVVEVAGQYLLIGAGEGGLSTLATLDEAQVTSALAAVSAGEKPLAVKLMELFGASKTGNREQAQKSQEL